MSKYTVVRKIELPNGETRTLMRCRVESTGQVRFSFAGRNAFRYSFATEREAMQKIRMMSARWLRGVL